MDAPRGRGSIPRVTSSASPPRWLAAVVLTSLLLATPARAQVATATTSPAGVLPSARAAEGGPNLLGTSSEVAAAALKGDVQGMIDALPAPSPALAASFAGMALARLALKSGVNAGGTGIVFNMMFWLPAIGVPFMYLAPLWSERALQADVLTRSVELDARMYLLTYDKKSPLTGQLRREPNGFGLGYDFAGRYSHPEYGLIAGGELTFQQTEIDGNDWANVSGFFIKVDPKVGIDLARLVGWATDFTWLRRQRISARVGPSLFHNWVYMGEEGGLFSTRPRDSRLNRGLGVASGTGYELVGEVALDLGWVGGIKVNAQRGVYPNLSFPEASGGDAALFALIGFDDLRAGDSYTWQRLSIDLDLPFLGFSPDGALTLGGQLSRLEAGTGAAVNNRGLSIGGSWRW